MSLNFSLLRKVALATATFGIVASSQAYLGTIYASHPSGAAGVAEGFGNDNWYGGLDIDVSFGAGLSLSHNIDGMGFLRWLQGPGGTGYNMRGKGYATADSNTNAFYSLCGQFRGIVTPTYFDVYESSTFGNPVTRAGNVVAFGVTGGTAFKHALNGDRYRAAGIQLAVWAAINGQGGLVFDVDQTNGNVKLWDGVSTVFLTTSNNDGADDANLVTVGNWAKFYYDQAVVNSSTNYSALYLDGGDAQGDEEGQDQITVDVPEPFTMSLGIAGMAAYIRRRMKTKRA